MYAISGGPQYPGSTDLSGSYAGVLKPKRQPNPDATPSPTPSPEDRNSLGVFAVTMPSAGGGSGSFVLFSHGEIYVGFIAAIADPTHASLGGVLRDAASSSAATNEVNGTMHARALHNNTSPFNSVGVQLRGHAMLDFENSATPHEWPRQPWFAEIGNVHRHGNLIIFTDGSISDLDTIVKKQSAK